MFYSVIKKSLLVASMLILISINNIFGQVGKEFWFAIPKETSGHSDLSSPFFTASFRITNQDTLLPALVTIEMPAPGSGFTKRVIPIGPGSTHTEILSSNDADFANYYANLAAWDAEAIPGITKRGILITSTQDITVYWDFNNINNRDLFSLKGKNALGNDFYLSYQNIWGGNNYTPTALCTADIVATVDGTVVTIYPTVKLKGRTDTIPFTVNLNRGETYSIVSKSGNVVDRFNGTRVTSNADHPIAITINNDSAPLGSCRDIIGDQTIPVTVCGMEYIVMTGNKSTQHTSTKIQDPLKGDQIFVTGTEANTLVEFFDKNGSLLYDTIIGARGTTYISPDVYRADESQTSIYVKASKPIYVLHITGIGCEVGGAIVPPITNCTGSYEVTFYRSRISSGGGSTITLNLMIRWNTGKSFTAADQSHNHFEVYYNGSMFKIPGTWFEPIANTGWAVLKKEYRSDDNAGIGNYIPIDLPATIKNSQDVFHLGITNGIDLSTNKYGYFSSFSAVTADANTLGTGEKAKPERKRTYCYGDTAYIQATGGSGYSWHLNSATGPTTYINSPNRGTTKVFCPPGQWNFYCIIDQAKCFGDDTIKVTVEVIPEVKAWIEATKAAACAPFNTIITNKSTGATKYSWSHKESNNPSDPFNTFIPPSQTSFVQPATGYFENNSQPYSPVIHTYRLLASYKGECPDTAYKEIVIYPNIKANFDPQDTTSCHPAEIKFRNRSNGNVADSLYKWEFGDGNSSPDKNPLHVFKNLFRTTDSTYKVSLVATSPFYCRDTARTNIKVYPYIKANFTVDTVQGCSPFTIKVTNISQNKGAISSFLWDFGDGTTRITSQDTLFHTFPVNKGSKRVYYKVLLTARHKYDNGCPDTLSGQITVYPQTSVNFIPKIESAIGLPTSVNGNYCDSTVLQFISYSTNAGAITTYKWDFGDGGTSKEENPFHLFRNSSDNDVTYKVKLTGITNDYCNADTFMEIRIHSYLDPQIAINTPSNCAPFNATIKNKSRGGIINYEWDFGDGTPHFNTALKDSVVHRYTNGSNSDKISRVKLIVKNPGGCKDSAMQFINIYPEIKADFSSDSIKGCNPLPVVFTNKSTYVNSIPKVAKYFKWDFGDSNTSEEQNPSHTFQNSSSVVAIYPVKLTVTSDNNCTAETIKEILVYPFIEARFSVDSVRGCSPYNINISNASRGGISSYEWTFGDGGNSNSWSKDLSHIYINNTSNNPSNQPLKRNMRLITRYLNLCESRDSIQITVYPEVNSNFTTNVVEGCNPLTVAFTNQSGPGTGAGKVPVEYNWTFGDGATSVNTNITPNTSHTYENITSSERTFKSRLIAYSTYKCSDTSDLNIKVYPLIDARFSFDEPGGCSPYTIKITNSSTAGVNGYHWFFGDGTPVTTTSAPKFNHTYMNQGNAHKIFYPTLVVDYNGKCQDTAFQSVQVNPEAVALFKVDTLKGCHPFDISFQDISRNAKYYSWIFGDRGTSTLPNPKHTYTNYSNEDSIYNLSLTVTSLYECTNTINKKVTVYPKPKALIEIGNTIACPPVDVVMKNRSEAGDFYTWTFGDGESVVSTNLSPITHRYDNLKENIETYNLNLFVQSVHNCTNEVSQTIDVYPHVVVDFTPDTFGCSPLYVTMKNNSLRTTNYKWDFGDNFTIKSPIRNQIHKFYNNTLDDITYKVSMIGYSDVGCTDTAFRNVLVHPQPLAGFKALPTPLYYPDARINIVNETNEGYWNYRWDFGDGQSSTFKEPGTHEFLNWGYYKIRLNAWSNYCSDSASIGIRVFAPKTIADFDASDNGCVPLTVNFTNHSTWATSYKWEFDDGSGSTEIHPSHIYQQPGKYQIKLTTYGDGAQDVTYREVVAYPKPIVKFDLSPGYVMLPEATVHYYNTSKLGNRYLWHFGDNDTSELFEPTHTYKELGTYDITLNVWTEHQCFDSVIMPRAVKVDGKGILDFPNAFKPALDGPSDGKYTYPDIKNTVFHPYHDGIKEYKLEIYDRWGELLFETTDVNIGWDGYFKGKLCKSDVYIWKAKGKFYNGSSFNKAGDVTILQ